MVTHDARKISSKSPVLTYVRHKVEKPAGGAGDTAIPVASTTVYRIYSLTLLSILYLLARLRPNGIMCVRIVHSFWTKDFSKNEDSANPGQFYVRSLSEFVAF